MYFTDKREVINVIVHYNIIVAQIEYYMMHKDKIQYHMMHWKKNKQYYDCPYYCNVGFQCQSKTRKVTKIIPPRTFEVMPHLATFHRNFTKPKNCH